MRKYGKILLVLGILAATPAVVSADGLLDGLRLNGSKTVQQQVNQRKAQEVAKALQDARVSGQDLSVEVRGNIVKIVGKVRNASHKAAAEKAARGVLGIDRVMNELTVASTKKSGRNSTNTIHRASYYESAEDSQQDVRQVHFRKPGRTTSRPSSRRHRQYRPQARSAQQPMARADYETNVEIPTPSEVEGPPPIPPEIQMEQERPVATPTPRPAPERVQPVSAEQPEPKSSSPSNQQVAQKIASSLADVGLQGYDVEIRYDNRIATLKGDVGTVQQLQAAGFAAARVSGVDDVKNQLQVQSPIAQTAFTPNGAPMMPMAMQGAPMGAPGMQAGPMAVAAAGNYSNPNLPNHAWPAYAQYPNSAAISYPKQHSASAFPYIGPFYPYPQVPLGWREVSLQWDDGQWQLDFQKKHDAWYWLWNPKNW